MLIPASRDEETLARRRSVVTLHVAFVLSGAVTYVAGALIPDLSRRWQLPYSTLGYLFVVQFISSGLGSVLSSRDLRRSVIAGYALIAIGMAALTLGWPVALAASACLGFGTGLSIPASNMTVARNYPDRRGAVLNRLNLLWSVGAIGCQLLFLVLEPETRADVAPWLLSMGATGCWLATWRWVRSPPEPARPTPAAPLGGATGAGRSALRVALALLAAQLLIYTGVEASVAGWLNALCAESLPAHHDLPFLVGTAFWGALIVGRALAPWLLERFTEARLHAGSLAVAALGLAVLLGTKALASYAIGAVLLGAGLAPIYALVASLVVARTGGTRAAGLVFAAGGVGPALLPWLTGQAASAAGSIRLAFLVPAAGIGILALLLQQYRRLR